MNFLFTLFAVAFAYTDVEYETHFKSFLTNFNKLYEGDEIVYRFNVFKTNFDAIHEHNAGNHSWTQGVNQFTDLTEVEFKKIYLGYIPRPRNFVKPVLEEHLADIDWRGKGAMTPIKDQKQCGSCWAFSATGGIEGAEFVKSGSVTASLSEQTLVDCSGSYGNQGCNGGLMDNAFKYVEAKGLPTEAAYPYTAKNGKCKTGYTIATKISTYKDVSSLEGPLATQPISVAVDAAKWSSYRSGTYKCSGKVSLDHGVLLAGSYSGYWIIKNSWGSSWGMNGFMQLDKTNDCGVTQAASFPSI